MMSYSWQCKEGQKINVYTLGRGNSRCKGPEADYVWPRRVVRLERSEQGVHSRVDLGKQVVVASLLAFVLRTRQRQWTVLNK